MWHGRVLILRMTTMVQFFDKFPIHRELISITKRHTSRNNTEFNLRHDWNVLLDNPEALPMTQRTKRRYPDASLLADYIRDFAAAQERRGLIQYNTTVRSIKRHNGVLFSDTPFARASGGGGGFDLVLERTTTSAAARQQQHQFSCGLLVVASGIDVPKLPAIQGVAEHATTYDQLPATGEEFEGKRVAVLGLGNAAFETATAMEDYASFVHLFYPRHDFLRSGKSWPHLSWETRYVGSLRAARAKPLDAYLLKSLDGYVSSNLAGGAVLRPCYTGERAAKCFFFRQPGFPNGHTRDQDFLQAGLLHSTDPKGSAFIAMLRHNGVHFDTRPCDGSFESSATVTIDPVNKQSTKWHTECWGLQRSDLSFVVVNASTIPDDDIAGQIHDYRHATVPGWKSNEAICCSAYDVVVSSVGWTHDTTVYDHALPTMPTTTTATAAADTQVLGGHDGGDDDAAEDDDDEIVDPVAPAMLAGRKYPRQSSEHESLNVPGMFFAGSLSHGRDWKKGAGGFVHGFRYTAKFLARVLALRFGRSNGSDSDHNGNGDGNGDVVEIDAESSGAAHRTRTGGLLTRAIEQLHALFPSRHWAPSSKWPLQVKATAGNVGEVTSEITRYFLARINEASAPYQARVEGCARAVCSDRCLRSFVRACARARVRWWSATPMLKQSATTTAAAARVREF